MKLKMKGKKENIFNRYNKTFKIKIKNIIKNERAKKKENIFRYLINFKKCKIRNEIFDIKRKK